MEPKSVLPAVWQVPQVFRDRLGEKAGRQRAMFADGHSLLVLHKPPRPEDDERVGRYRWRDPDGKWSSDELGSGPNALTRHMNEYAELIEQFERQDEAADSADDYFKVVYGVSPLHRATRNLHQTLQDAREHCPQDRDIINFRDRAYQIERTAELLFNDAKNGLDYAIAKQTEEQSAAAHRMETSAHRLNILAAFFFPIVTVSTILGMNLKHGLEGVNESYGPLPFLGVLGLGLVLGFMLKSLVTADHPKRTK